MLDVHIYNRDNKLNLFNFHCLYIKKKYLFTVRFLGGKKLRHNKKLFYPLSLKILQINKLVKFQ
jgi:hypothetical protein